MHFLLLLFLATLLCSTTSAQRPEGWLIYFGNTKLKNTKFSLHHELQLRDYKIVGDHNQSLLRVGGQYQLKPYLQTTLGYGFVYSELKGGPNNPFNEHRIYQEALLFHQINSGKMRHRLRLEERFIERQDFRGRFRYGLFFDVPLSKEAFAVNTTYLALYNEVFLNLSNAPGLKAFDRNRLYAGFGYQLRKNLAVQLGFMNQNVNSNKGTQHVLLSLHHQIRWD